MPIQPDEDHDSEEYQHEDGRLYEDLEKDVSMMLYNTEDQVTKESNRANDMAEGKMIKIIEGLASSLNAEQLTTMSREAIGAANIENVPRDTETTMRILAGVFSLAHAVQTGTRAMDENGKIIG